MRPDRITAVSGMSVQFRQPEGRSFSQQGRQYLRRPGVNENVQRGADKHGRQARKASHRTQKARIFRRIDGNS